MKSTLSLISLASFALLHSASADLVYSGSCDTFRDQYDGEVLSEDGELLLADQATVLFDVSFDFESSKNDSLKRDHERRCMIFEDGKRLLFQGKHVIPAQAHDYDDYIYKKSKCWTQKLSSKTLENLEDLRLAALQEPAEKWGNPLDEDEKVELEHQYSIEMRGVTNAMTPLNRAYWGAPLVLRQSKSAIELQRQILEICRSTPHFQKWTRKIFGSNRPPHSAL